MFVIIVDNNIGDEFERGDELGTTIGDGEVPMADDGIEAEISTFRIYFIEPKFDDGDDE